MTATNKQISQMPSASSVSTDDLIPIVQGGVNKKSVASLLGSLTSGDTTYLRLDTTNAPLTGALPIKVDNTSALDVQKSDGTPLVTVDTTENGPNFARLVINGTDVDGVLTQTINGYGVNASSQNSVGVGGSGIGANSAGGQFSSNLGHGVVIYAGQVPGSAASALQINRPGTQAPFETTPTIEILDNSHGTADLIYAYGGNPAHPSQPDIAFRVLHSGTVLAAEKIISQPLGDVSTPNTTLAGIALDPNAATGFFQHNLSPANLTSDRRATFQDSDGVVAYLSNILPIVNSDPTDTSLPWILNDSGTYKLSIKVGATKYRIPFVAE